MFSEGVTVSKIVEMGVVYTPKQVVSALRQLASEGMITIDTTAKLSVYQITEKACEYCETVARKYAGSHVMEAIADYVLTAEVTEATAEATEAEATEAVESTAKATEAVEPVRYSNVPENTQEHKVHDKHALARKLWTPRKHLVVMAAHHAVHYRLTSYIAIEEVIQDWQQKKINMKSVEYYLNLSHQGQLRLITDVKNWLGIQEK